jgi:hypothetical protein
MATTLKTNANRLNIHPLPLTRSYGLKSGNFKPRGPVFIWAAGI